MSFATTLEKIVQGAGAWGVALMGSDGIPIEQVEGVGGDDHDGEEVGAAGVEFGRVLDEVRKASDALGGGAVSELVVRAGRFAVLLRAVGEETFLVILLPPDGNLGKARYLARRHLLEIQEMI